jgi:hypothetical protein
MTQPTETDPKTKERASLLLRGIVLLALSGVVTLALPSVSGGGDNRGRLILAWAGQAAFWLGLTCVAGHVLAEVLRGRRPT